MADSKSQREGNSFVDTLVKLQDSAKILASNEQAAAEALESVRKAREEEKEIKERTAKLVAGGKAAWQDASQQVEGMMILAKNIKAQSQKEYDAHVSAGVAEGRRKHDEWKDKTKAAEAEHSAKRAEIAETDRELDARRALLDNVKKEMLHLHLRLKP